MYISQLPKQLLIIIDSTTNYCTVIIHGQGFSGNCCRSPPSCKRCQKLQCGSRQAERFERSYICITSWCIVIITADAFLELDDADADAPILFWLQITRIAARAWKPKHLHPKQLVFRKLLEPQWETICSHTEFETADFSIQNPMQRSPIPSS
jgi:hypothetical protein